MDDELFKDLRNPKNIPISNSSIQVGIKKILYSSSYPMDAVILTFKQAREEIKRIIENEQIKNDPDMEVLGKASAIQRELKASIETYKEPWDKRNFFNLSPRQKILIIEGIIKSAPSWQKIPNTKKAKVYSSLFRIGAEAIRINLSYLKWKEDDNEKIIEFFQRTH